MIVNFLTGSRMAFVLDHTPLEIIPFEQQQFVLPALLPTEPPLGVQIWGEPQPKEWWVDCSYAFLHRGLIETIIVRTAQLSPHREWWRDGIIFSDEKTGCQVLVEYAPEADLPSTIRFRFRGKGQPQTRVKVNRLLRELHPHRQPDLWVSLDGKDFVSLSALGQARQGGKSQVVTREQDIVDAQTYHLFLQLPEFDTDQEVFPDPSSPTRRMRIFISYAHKDEDPYLDRMKVCWKNLKRRFPIEFWEDRQLFAGEPWEAEILQQLEQADIVCLLISPDFFASDYCFFMEMEKALAKYEQGKGIPIPILIRATSDWEQFPIGRHQALPTPAKPLAQWQDPDEFLASVQHGLRQQIERLLNKNSFQ